MTKKPGYIIVLTLLVISLSIGLVTAIVRQVFSYQRQARFSFDKGRVRMLSLSSIEIALSQLSLVLAKEAEQKPQGPPAKSPPAQGATGEKKDNYQQWATKVLPYLNRWQTFDLEGNNGLEGSIRIYIASEQGKISLAYLENSLDQEKKMQEEEQKAAPVQPGPQRPGPQRAPPQPLERKDPLSFIDQLVSNEKEVSIKNALKDFRNQFKRSPDDPSELLRIRGFEKFKDSLFLNTEITDRSFALMDLFTLGFFDSKINPFLLSRSVKKLLGFTESKDSKALAKGVKSSMNWFLDWDKIFEPVYGKKYAALDPVLKVMLATTFAVTSFSVVSYCKIGNVTQKIYALIEVTQPDEEFSPKSLIFKVSRIYWL
ncbi:hypothetical protein H0X06_05460 [Candidatus Dependentiae bacterium]|nr:hypothetical protein [Candidatus Dependentiae bacterium]